MIPSTRPARFGHGPGEILPGLFKSFGRHVRSGHSFWHYSSFRTLPRHGDCHTKRFKCAIQFHPHQTDRHTLSFSLSLSLSLSFSLPISLSLSPSLSLFLSPSPSLSLSLSLTHTHTLSLSLCAARDASAASVSRESSLLATYCSESTTSTLDDSIDRPCAMEVLNSLFHVA